MLVEPPPIFCVAEETLRAVIVTSLPSQRRRQNAPDASVTPRKSHSMRGRLVQVPGEIRKKLHAAFLCPRMNNLLLGAPLPSRRLATLKRRNLCRNFTESAKPKSASSKPGHTLATVKIALSKYRERDPRRGARFRGEAGENSLRIEQGADDLRIGKDCFRTIFPRRRSG
jgi:hypothetical protein